ncbi:MAG: response regulator [Clostridiales bacterium]|jgi:putative two-component system response regulator|nr:response regulator [Clostridiales bacterium]
MSKKKIILVDDSIEMLTLCKQMIKDVYDVYTVQSADRLFEILKRVIPDMILLDVKMPVVDGYEIARLLKSSEVYRDIPIIFLTAMDDVKSEMEGLSIGALDYIHKPFVAALLLRRIETHLSLIDGRKELISLNKSFERILEVKTKEVVQRKAAEEAAHKSSKEKKDGLAKIYREINEPLSVITDMIRKGLRADNMNDVRKCLIKAKDAAERITRVMGEITEIEGADNAKD